jgi:hypothetical protein
MSKQETKLDRLKSYAKENPYTSAFIGVILMCLVLYTVLYIAIAPVEPNVWISSDVDTTDNDKLVVDYNIPFETDRMIVQVGEEKTSYDIERDPNEQYSADKGFELEKSEYFVDYNEDGFYEEAEVKVTFERDCELMSPCITWWSFGTIPEVKINGIVSDTHKITPTYDKPKAFAGDSNKDNHFTVSLDDYDTNSLVVMTPKGEYIENYYYNPSTEQYEGEKGTYVSKVNDIGETRGDILTIHSDAEEVYIIQKEDGRKYLIKTISPEDK